MTLDVAIHQLAYGTLLYAGLRAVWEMILIRKHQQGRKP